MEKIINKYIKEAVREAKKCKVKIPSTPFTKMGYYKKISYESIKLKQLQMKLGRSYQKIIGSIDGFEDLEVGHKTGLDILNNQKKIIMELKSATNTDNSKSKEQAFENLINSDKYYPNYEKIYACFFDISNEEGIDKLINHKEQFIRYLTGNKLKQFIFGNLEINKLLDSALNKAIEEEKLFEDIQ